jgi:hypothetical protein
MLDPSAPPVLQQWIANPPPWLIVQTVFEVDATLHALDPGEQAAITLAQTLPAVLLIIDERLEHRFSNGLLSKNTYKNTWERRTAKRISDTVGESNLSVLHFEVRKNF